LNTSMYMAMDMGAKKNKSFFCSSNCIIASS
jgi:hypothetical protein